MRSLLFVAAFALAACSSTSSSESPGATGPPTRVTLTQWRDGQYFELVNDSYTTNVDATSRVELYSTVRSDAQRKVQNDEVMDELMTFYGEHGFGTLSTPGHAPKPNVGTSGWTIEVESPDGVRYAVTVGRLANEKLELNRMIQAFFEIWNNTFSLQSVEVDPGESPFKQPKMPGR